LLGRESFDFSELGRLRTNDYSEAWLKIQRHRRRRLRGRVRSDL
jgi:hypothetical protein